MYKQSTIAITTFNLAFSLTLTLATTAAGATKLNAAPLPHERESKDFNTKEGQFIINQPSRFQRRPDFRELEAQQKKESEEAAKRAEQSKLQAIQDHKHAQDEAIDNYKKRQDLAIAANNKAVACGKQGRWLDALSAHEQAVQLDPQSKQFRINLSAARVEYGKAKLAGGDLTAAAGLFRKALAAAPDNGLAGKLLAQAMGKQGRDPMSADIRLATADQLAAVGDYEGASVEYEAAMQLESSARTYTKMGDLALRFGQHSTAINWYRQAIVKDTDYGPAHRQLGLLALNQKDYTGAAASLRKAVILDSHDTAAGQALVEIWRKQVSTNPLLAENHLGLAGALQLTGDFIGADSEYRRLEALDPKNPGLASGRQSLARAIQHDKAEKHRLAAETLFNQGLRREALAEISQSVMMEPRNARYQFLLAECLEANGDYQGAHQAYLTCVLIDPENNQEAAARMKEMQNSSHRTPTAPVAPTAAPRSLQPPVTAGMQNTFNAAAAPNLSMSKKDMFEAAPVAQTAPTSQVNQPATAAQTGLAAQAMRGNQVVATNQPAASQAQQIPTSANGARQASAGRTATTGNTATNAAPQLEPALQEADARVKEAEAERDFPRAIEILKQLLVTYTQNSNIHHRLAVNLLNSGDINEAVAEFRIASALNPKKKEFADDLAQALLIHKRALMSEAGSQISGENAGATK